ncbi:probable protein phosphatase DDB_G0282105 [Polistes fuscatus]|uniref:probable protein phosphatase DDB_G0282105 n=1 Tax=Polistes fuscatus TaxID=30207 RepID=UPI001CA7F339|nr:probable protein phosphatase DDB_G0282105 [Polistes fuscatus]
MLKIVDSTKFILTLQSSPPFLVENIFVLALVILLAVPLIVNLQFCLDKSRIKKGTTSTTTVTVTNGTNEKWNKIIRRRIGIVESNSVESNIHENDDDHRETGRSIRNSEERIRRAVVMHYPAPIPIDSSSSSDYDLRFSSSNRRAVSTPNLCSNSGGDGPGHYENYHNHHKNNHHTSSCNSELLNDINKKIKLEKEVPVERSSSFVVTNSEVPIIDISTFNYNAYRHKLIEANLKKYYKNNQPPGDVIFNSIHLNTIDSTLGIKLNEQYDHSFFDFVEEYYDATIGMSKKEMEFLHPLDHFLVKGIRQRETDEKGTETLNLSNNEKTTRIDRVKDIDEKISINRRVLDKNGNISRKSKVKNLSSSLSKRRKEEDSRINSNVDQVQTRRKYLLTKSVNGNDTLNSPSKSKLLSSIVKADKDSINLSSISSSEFGSTRDVISNHSRDSSIPSGCRARTPTRKLLPWITGNTSFSFNRKYGNNSTDISDKLKKRTIHSSERSSNFGSRPTTPRPRSANLTLTSKRKTKDNLNVVEPKETLKAFEDYTVNGKGSIPAEICSDFIESSFTLGTPITPASTLPSSNSSRLVPKLLDGSFENDDSKRSMFENVSAKSYPKFHEKNNKRDRRNRESGRKIIPDKPENTNPSNHLNNKGIAKVNLNSNRRKSNYSIKSYETTIDENLTTSKNILGKQMAEINQIESKNESLSRTRKYNNNNNNNINQDKARSDVILKRESKKLGELSNSSDKNVEFSQGHKSDRFSSTKTEDTSRSVILQSRDTLVLATNDSRIEKHRSNEKKLDKLSELRSNRAADSSIGFAVQTGLKNYIKTLKELLKNEANLDSVDLASLSLKDAISPKLESILSVSELKELQDLLNLAEIKSNLTNKNVA